MCDPPFPYQPLHNSGVFLRFVLALVLTLAGSAGRAAASGASEPFAWSDRGMFVFSYVVLDFQAGEELQGVGPHITRLVNCSTAEFYCAYADLTHIVLPRKCSGLNGDGPWSVNGVTTNVLYRGEDVGARHGANRILLLGDPKFPKVVYEYDPDRGVLGFYFSQFDGADLVKLASGGPAGLAKYRNRDTYFGLVTLDRFGMCAH